MTTAHQDAYHVITATNSAIGPGALVINNVGSLSLEWKRPLEIPQRAAEEGLGRDDELAELHSRFRLKTHAAITGMGTSGAVRGLPGVGKSTLAALYAVRFQEHYTAGVLWLTFGPEARGPESVNPFLNRIAAYAYRADAQVQTLLAHAQFSPEVVRALLSGHGPILLVADDVWDRNLLEPLRQTLPPASHLLVTTRDSRVANQLGTSLSLDVLSEADALSCVHRILPGMPGAQQRRLIEAVSRHPLALSVVLGDLVERGEEEWADCIGQIERMLREGRGFGDLPLMDEAERESRVEAALRHSYEAMAPEFQRRFRALGCMAQEADFDTAAAAALWGDSEAEARAHLNVLVARALLKRQSDGRWQQHAILRAYALSLQGPDERQARGRDHAAHYLEVITACVKHKPQDYDRLEQEFRQVEQGFSWAQQHDPELVSILAVFCDEFLLIRGRFNLLKPWLQASLLAARSIGNRSGEADTHRRLGDLEDFLGNRDTARAHYDAALPLYKAEQDRLGMADTLRSLGYLEDHLGNIDTARAHYDAALLIYVAEQNHMGTANIHQCLGDLEDFLGNFDAARAHYEAALPFYAAEQSRLGTANTLLGLGTLESRLGNLDAARIHYNEALSLYVAEQARTGTPNTHKSLGDLESRLGNLDAARAHYDAARSLYAAEQDRLGTAGTLQILGDLEGYLGNVDAARAHYDEALSLYEDASEPEGQMIINLALARLERARGNTKQAQEHYRLLLDQAQQLPGFAEEPVTQEAHAEYHQLLSEMEREHEG